MPLDDAGFPEPYDAEPVDARLLRVERDAGYGTPTTVSPTAAECSFVS